MHATTIIAVRRGAAVAMAGDGQVTLDATIVKGSARKVRTVADGSILEMPIGLALLAMDGRARTVHVAFGPDDNVIVVGAMTLERFGVAVDPVRQSLIPATITM